MKLKLNSEYVLAFLLLTMICGLSHELVHHITGAIICGCWGFKTFNSFSLCPSCEGNPYSLIATAAGPLFTFALMWIGWYRLQKPDNKNKQLGFALIFANFPINRILFAIMGFNDEQFITITLFGDSKIAFWTTVGIVLALSVPPLWMAYSSISNRFRLLWFLGFFVLPFIFVFIFAGLFLEEYVLLEARVLADTFLGVPYLLWFIELFCLVLYAYTKKYIYQNSEMSKPVNV